VSTKDTPQRVQRRGRQVALPVQIALVLALWLLGQLLVRWTALPLPGAVAGMLILLVLLATRRLELGCVKAGADWFLAEMLLFFVPAALAVQDHRELLGWVGLKVLLVILVGTAVVMVATALLVELASRLTCERPEA
jgi:holin-like protein